MTSNTNNSKDVGIRVDDKEVIKSLSKLSFKQMNKAYREGMKKALNPILRQTKINLKNSGIKNVNKPYVGKNGKQYFSI